MTWETLWPWLAFNGFVLAMLALDLGVFHRTAHEVSLKEAGIWSAVWIALALALDGGRMLRAGLAMVTDYQRATRIAAGAGQLLAIGLGVLGVVGGNFLLVLVAVFVFFGAGMETVQTAARTVLTTLRVGDAYNRHALTLAPADRVSTVVDYLLTSYQPDFGVVHAGRLLGVVTRDDVLKALASQEEDPYVTGIMQREVEHVDAQVGLDEVHQLMSEKSTRLVAVHDGERFLGLVSADDIAEALAAVLQRQRRLRPALAD